MTARKPSFRCATIVGRSASASREHAEAALTAAWAAFEDWKLWKQEDRSRVMLKAAAIMRRRKRELEAWLVFEIGKNFVEASAEVARFQLLLTQDAVARETALVWVELSRQQAMSQIATSQVEGVKALANLAMEREKKGASTRSDSLQAQARVESAAAPCQCRTFGGQTTTSPACSSWGGCPSCCSQPWPAVTSRICPLGCVCQRL